MILEYFKQLLIIIILSIVRLNGVKISYKIIYFYLLSN